MKNTVLQYTFRVWVTSVVVSPILFGLLLLIRQIITIAELVDYGWHLIGMYMVLAVLQLLFSFVTWIVFLLIVNIISLIPLPNLLMKLTIFFIGIALTVCTFMALEDFTAVTGAGNELINLMYANCAGIGWAVWYYKLDIKVKGSQNPQIAETMNKKRISIKNMGLLPTIAIATIFLYGCNRRHLDTDEIRPRLFIETFSAGLIGNLSAQYLTDSVNFRIYIGTFDDESEWFYYRFKGDSIFVEKIQRIDKTALLKTTDKKTYSLIDLKKMRSL